MSDPRKGPPIAMKTKPCAASIALFLGVHSLFASVLVTDITTQSDIDRLCPYTLLQIGGPRDGELLVGSESWVGGNIGKAKDTSDNFLKLSSSHVTGEAHWETNVTYDESSSTVDGGDHEKTQAEFTAIRNSALDVAADLAALPGVNDGGFDLNNQDRTIVGNGGVNVFHVTSNFHLNGSTLTLEGGEHDVFIFNIPMGKQFELNSGAEIALSSDLDPRRVVFNVAGEVGGPGGLDDTKIQESLFRGTLIATGRNVLVNDNEYAEGNGLYGSIITGGKLIFEESDITHECFEPLSAIPESSTFALCLLGAGLLGLKRSRTS